MLRPTCRFVKITPVMAQEWLEKAAKGRKVKESRVTLYSKMMKRGDWMVTHQGIAFDDRGHLLDGQHRLRSIVESGTTCEVLVVENLKAATVVVMDQGAFRQMHDQMSINQGSVITPRYVATAKQMMTSVHLPTKDDRVALRDVMLVERFLVKHSEAIRFADALFNKTVPRVSVAAVIAPIARAWYSQNRKKLTEFAAIVSSGMSTNVDASPVIVLRNYLITSGDMMRELHTRVKVYRKTEQALRAFLDREQWTKFPRREAEFELFLIPGEQAHPTTEQVKPRLRKSSDEQAKAAPE